MATKSTIALLSLLLCLPPLHADLPKAISVSPMAIPPGTKSTLVVNGLNLTDATNLWTDLSAQIENAGNSNDSRQQIASALANGEMIPDGAIIREAESYDRGQYRKNGAGILNGDFKPNFAEWDFDVATGGNFVLELMYASGGSRPVKVFLNGRLLTETAAAGGTGGFADSDAKWMVEGVLTLKNGRNTLRIEKTGGTPHFDKIALVPTKLPASRFSSVAPTDRVAPFDLEVTDNTPVGIHGLRVATREGISNMLLFMVDDLPTVAEIRGQTGSEAGQQIRHPVAVEGYCDVGRADRYVFDATAGEELSFEVVAARLGSKLDPMLKLLTHDGRELAFVDDSAGFAGDCCWRHKFETAGRFVLEIEDALMNGASAHRYRLRIGDFPLITSVMPATAVDQPTTTVQFAGPASDGLEPLDVDVKSGRVHSKESDTRPRVSLHRGVMKVSTAFPGKIGSGFAQLSVASHSGSVFDPKADDNRLTIPQNVFGVLKEPSAAHVWKFSATRGQKLRLSDFTRSLGRAAMPAMQICDESGKVLQDVHKAGPGGSVLKWTAPADGEYTLQLRDLTHRTGPEFSYSVSVDEDQPDYQLSVEQDNSILPQNGYTILKVAAVRNGYNGPITLQVSGLGDNVKLRNNIIAKMKKDTRLKIYLPDSYKPGQTATVEIIGTADVDGNAVQRTALTTTAFRKNLTSTPFPPPALNGLIAATVAPEIPDFFALSLDDGVILFPRHVGEVYFTVRVKDRSKGFASPVNIRIEGFPDGFSASGGERPVSRSENNEYRFQLRGPQDIASSVQKVSIVAEAGFKGQTKEVELRDVPLKIIEPLIISATTSGPLKPGGSQQLQIAARRFVPRAGGDKQQINLSFADIPNGISLPTNAFIPAGSNEARVNITIDASANVSAATNIRISAKTQVAGKDVNVTTKLELGKP